jgi:glycosyltransferase involved in cell wall biosynthesis
LQVSAKSMPDVPFFTVVVAAFDRGEHIVPTVEAALGQSFTNFELLVVGDGVTDDTLARVPKDDSRVGVICLPWNSGSQSTPNNVGIAAARGRYVAYLGHDDIWMPDHLAALAHLFEDRGCDVAVSGCVYHGPPGTELVLVTGIFEEPEAARRHFFPPTSLAHRASLATEIGGWRDPLAIPAPVDSDFLLRAVDAGARFCSTGRVTAHKFAAGHRYLGYLDPSSAEQRETLSGIRSGVIDRQVCADYVERAKGAGTFMTMAYSDFSTQKPGELFRMNRSNKGLDRTAPVPLTKEVFVAQSYEPRALDWYAAEQTSQGGHRFRYSGPSLRPKLLIPFTGDLDVRITLHIWDYIWDLDPGRIIDGMRLRFNGEPVVHRMSRGQSGRVDLAFTGRLLHERPSILELVLARAFCPAEVNGSADRRKLGVMLTGFTIAPMPPDSNHLNLQPTAMS